MDLHSLTREQLYDLVWKKPLILLAPEFGVSDVAVKKRCKRLGVPTPSRGYWAKVESGIRPHKTKLPDSIPDRVRRQKQVSSFEYFEVQGKNYGLKQPHEFVVLTKEQLRSARTDRKGLVATHGKSVYVEISLVVTNRAMWLLNSLLKELAVLDLRIDLRDGYRGGLHVHHKDAVLKIQIRESVRQFPNPNYNATLGYVPGFGNETLVYRCSGRLKIQIKGDYCSDGEWIDQPGKPLDDRIEEVSKGILARLEDLVERNAKWREDERIAQISREIQRKVQMERVVEEKRLKELEQLAEQFDVSQKVTRLANEVKATMASKGITLVELDSAANWLEWATTHADNLNPVRGIVDSLLSESSKGS